MMKGTTPLLAILLLALLSAGAATDRSTTLRFNTSARTFHETLPLGNGRIGAMVFGGVDEERIVLNESSMWSGSRGDVEDRVWSELKHH